MNKSWFTSLKDIGNLLRDTFLLPGDFVTVVFASQLEIIGGIDKSLLSVSISALSWLLLLTVAWKLVKFGQRIVSDFGITIRAHVSVLKSRLTRRHSLVLPRNRPDNSATGTEVEFDDLDLAVLDTAATLNPGFALSAPDLAAQLQSRPTKVQSSLEKLAVNTLLERCLGSTDDYQNYRVSRAGVAFLSLLKRRR